MAGETNNRVNARNGKPEQRDEPSGSRPGPETLERPEDEPTAAERGHTPGERTMPERQPDTEP